MHVKYLLLKTQYFTQLSKRILHLDIVLTVINPN